MLHRLQILVGGSLCGQGDDLIFEQVTHLLQLEDGLLGQQCTQESAIQHFVASSQMNVPRPAWALMMPFCSPGPCMVG